MSTKTHWWLKYLLILLIVLFFGTLVTSPILLSQQDLGRHIKNGQEILSGKWSVLFENHYSFTDPNHKFINHHWLSGVVFYLIYKFGGFKVLHLFHTLVYCLSFYLLIRLMKRKGTWVSALLLAPFAILFLALRQEVRPETFGYFFLVHTLWQINFIIKEGKISRKQIIILLGQQLLWVNLHLSFIFSIFCFGALLILKLLDKKFLTQVSFKKVSLSLGGLILISLINPNHIYNLVEPLFIFSDYGYPVAENKNLLFLNRVINSNLIYSFSGFSLLFLILLGLNHKKINNWDLFLSITGLILGFSALRHITLFVFFSFPVAARYLSNLINKLSHQIRIENKKLTAIYLTLVTFSLSVISSLSGLISPKFKLRNRHLGIIKQEEQAAAFFKDQQLSGPIFNNYDVGSYLIFHLYPHEKVFVDNRPEAYTTDFFQNQYIPMQQKNEVWQKLSKQYKFKTIFVRRNDQTPWFKQFINQRIKDNKWQLIYEDQFCLILTQSH